MHDLKLFVAPGTCARVPTIALEEIGVSFETELVRLSAGQQKSPEFLAINPKGKVPTLLIDGRALTENVAILTWLNQSYSAGQLLPETIDPIEKAAQISDLAFFSATVHPIVTRIAMPMFFLEGGDPFNTIRPKGVEAMIPVMTMINKRLEGGEWWYGEKWSIVDAYLFWAWWRITGVGFAQNNFPRIVEHAKNIVTRPSVQRALERETQCIDILKHEGIYISPD